MTLQAAGLPGINHASDTGTWDYPGLYREENSGWTNWPQTVNRVLDRNYQPWNIGDDHTQNNSEAGATNLSRVVTEAIAAKARLRPYGATWSFSEAVVGAGDPSPVWGVDMRGLGMVFAPFAPTALVTPAESTTLLHVQAGTEIFRVNYVAQQRNRSLFSVGGSQGQTIGGAISTGTHGGFIQRRPIADYVRAARIITNKGQFWIEGGKPVLTDASKAALGSHGITAITDAEVLNAVAVSLGAIGALVSVVLDTDVIYYLQMKRTIEVLDADLRGQIASQAFGTSPPFHFECIVDPYRAAAGAASCYVTRGYRSTTRSSAPSDLPAQDTGTNPFLGDVLAGLMNVAPASIPATMIALFNQFYPATTWPSLYTLAEFFPRGGPSQYIVQSIELAMPQAQAVAALDAIIKLIDSQAQVGTFFGGIIAVRMSVGTSTLLGLSRWPQTCTFEISAPRNFRSTATTFDAIRAVLKRNGIPFTQHPGQMVSLTAPDFASGWGSATVAAWKSARAEITDPTMFDPFVSKFAQTLGLV